MDYSQKIRERYAELKSISKQNSKGSISSLDRIAEFRKKIEGSFSSKLEQKSSFLEEEPKYPSKFLIEKPSFIAPKYAGSVSLSKNSSFNSITLGNKPKLQEKIPIDAIISLKKALISASDEEIRDLPYLYSFTLHKFCGHFHEKLKNN